MKHQNQLVNAEGEIIRTTLSWIERPRNREQIFLNNLQMLVKDTYQMDQRSNSIFEGVVGFNWRFHAFDRIEKNWWILSETFTMYRHFAHEEAWITDKKKSLYHHAMLSLTSKGSEESGSYHLAQQPSLEKIRLNL